MDTGVQDITSCSFKTLEGRIKEKKVSVSRFFSNVFLPEWYHLVMSGDSSKEGKGNKLFNFLHPLEYIESVESWIWVWGNQHTMSNTEPIQGSKTILTTCFLPTLSLMKIFF